MYAYCNNAPIIHHDPTGESLDTIWDIVSLGQSLGEVIANPANPVAWFSLAADAACLVIPGLTGGGGIVRFVANADKIADAAKYADDVVDTAKAIKSSFEMGNNMHDAYMVLDQASGLYRNRTLGTVYEEISSRLRPDAIDTVNNILYELKPYNQESFVRAVKQVQKYLALIPAGADEWTVVIDMYY